MLNKVVKYAKKKLRVRMPKLQELLLRQAMLEEGLDIPHKGLKIDHDIGKSYIGDFQVGIVYPRSFFDATAPCAVQRSIDYYFNGFEGADDGRRKLLSAYSGYKCKIIFTRAGRTKKKMLFNEEYYEGMMSAKFGLCPHQLDWTGNWSVLWTYRFIEAAMCGAIPILFRRTPLCDDFIKEFNYYWDDEVHTFDSEKSLHNRRMSIAHHSLMDLQGDALRDYLKREEC